ncbi:phosphotransferase [Streptomyces erythrochromogenes]|uniref:phosphotransferase n=1 Tax=Streptomyces erythrochromogenes TaxID=285574 RepID=UPI003F4E2B88
MLADIPPIDQLVVCHGDPCSPNTLVGDDGTWTGRVDLGTLGVADRWADLAVVTWSTQRNTALKGRSRCSKPMELPRTGNGSCTTGCCGTCRTENRCRPDKTETPRSVDLDHERRPQDARRRSRHRPADRQQAVPTRSFPGVRWPGSSPWTGRGACPCQGGTCRRGRNTILMRCSVMYRCAVLAPTPEPVARP